MFHILGTYVETTSEEAMAMIIRLLSVIYRYASAGTMKLEKTLKNMDNVLAKIVKKSIFSKMKLTGLLTKKCASFPSNICPVF